MEPEMNDNAIVQVICIIGIVAVAVIAAITNKWEVVSMALTGGFALLRTTDRRPGNEKNSNAPDPVEPDPAGK